MHFGEFLLQQRAVTPGQVLDALDVQRKLTPFLGTLAVREGAMSVTQVLDVLHALNRIGPQGVHFGEIALERGYIDEETRDRLLALQRQTFEPLGELLVESGALQRAEMTEMLKAYLKSQKAKPAPSARETVATNPES